MAKRIANEIKTGLLILLCLIILAGFTLAITNFMGIEKTYELKAMFNWVGGLEEHAPVRLRGVEAGEVKDVEILYRGDETKILLTLLLKEKAKVREGTKAYVSMLGMMGEKYVELTDGPPGAPFLKPGSVITGEDPTMTEELINIGRKVATGVESTMADMRSLINNLDKLVLENREDIDFIIGKLKTTAANFEAFSDDIRRYPWKLLIKTKEKKKPEKGRSREKK
ncbi:MAG: MCE family protein [Candidatus Omnitrophota bacterium]|nr:MAG: MCE family protein [Candidatus Omnitrophota bacterium]